MKSLKSTVFALALLLVAGISAHAQAPVTPKPAAPGLVEFEFMTWPELKSAIHDQGKTTVLLFNGGTEQRGPQGISGAHTLVAREVGKEIALKLGNAIVAPVLPFSVNRASARLPGTIGVSGPLFAQINEEVAEQLITNGFKNVVLMGDHGGGQEELAGVAKKLDAKYASQGIRVVYCDDVYKKAGDDINTWLKANGYPIGSHAGIKDTSELLYLGGDKGYVRKELLPTAVTDAGHTNGISGDARRSSPEIGKQVTKIKTDDAVAQIQQLLSAPAPVATTAP